MDDLTQEFLAESLEGLDRMDRCLTELEARPDDAELLGEIFRAVHTIKGTTGFLGFSRLEKLAHAGENLLGSLRDGRLKANPELVSGLLLLMDGLRAILQLIEKTGKEGTRRSDEDSGLIALMAELNEGRAPGPLLTLPMMKWGEEPVAGEETPAAEQPAAVQPAAMQPALAQPVEAQLEVQTKVEAGSGVGEKTLRIDVEVLNRMMDLVGELVLTRNQILQSHVEAESFPELARRLDSVTADLRETVMQARMQPVGNLFQRFPRMVRDLAKSCGKRVRVEFTGQETGLDKSLLEAMKDPLTHAVRNAIDHGIEEPGARALAGKPLEGVVWLRAWQHNGSVVIEVADDGGGIGTERVLAKALERGLITKDQATTMTEREVLQLVFLPGFSTAAAVTHVSGRGVGMDVVMANVEKVGGTVELESRPGQGTTLRLRVPLTLAIVRALVVRSGGQSFCLPQSALAELVYVPAREEEFAVERIGEAEVYRLRDRLLPMVRLDWLLGLERVQPAHPGGTGVNGAQGFYLVVLEGEGCRYGLVVDDLMAPEEIVVKPLSPVLREIGMFTGATVLGNGALAMILDLAGMAQRAGVRPVAEKPETVAAAVAGEGEIAPVGSSFLIFEEGGADRGDGGESARMALPLGAVERIETVPVREVEYAGGRALLQYRGELLPLMDSGGMLRAAVESGVEEATVTVLICGQARGGQGRARLGMVVREVLDVASGELMERDVRVCAERLVMVNERLTVVHEAFCADEGESEPWRKVA